MSQAQRRLRNLLLKPLLQMKLGLYSILLSVVFAVLIVFVINSSFERLFQFVLDLTDAREQVMVQVKSQFNVMLGWLLLITSGYLVMVVLLSIMYTHRLIGPTIAFRRHIRALMEGRYDSRITLRKSDEFAEVAEDLNQLAASLQQKKH